MMLALKILVLAVLVFVAFSVWFMKVFGPWFFRKAVAECERRAALCRELGKVAKAEKLQVLAARNRQHLED